MIETRAVLQPGGVTAEPAQDGRQVGFTPLRANGSVDRVVQHDRGKTAGLQRRVLQRIISRPHPWFGAVQTLRLHLIGGLLVGVIGAGVDGAHLQGGYGAQVAHARKVGGEEQEEVAAARQFIAPLVHPHRQAVKWVLPTGAQEGCRGCVIAGVTDPAAYHVLRSEPHDAPCQRINTPGFQRLALQLLAVRGVAFRGIIPQSAADEERGVCFNRGAQAGVFRLADAVDQAFEDAG